MPSPSVLQVRVQGCRMRNTKTEYVSCPSCGRTLFDLQEVTEQIRSRTGHLPGVSVAIMGCASDCRGAKVENTEQIRSRTDGALAGGLCRHHGVCP